MKSRISSPGNSRPSVLLLALLLFSLANAPVHGAYTIPSSGLVGWWEGNGNANDSSALGNNGTAIGVSYVAGVSGQAFSFVPPQTRVTIADNAAYQLTSLSIQGWIFPMGTGGIVFFRGDNRVGLDPYSMDMNDSAHPTNINFNLENGSGSVVSLHAPIALNQWQHIAGTFDGGTGDMRLYVNGALTSETSTALRPLLALDPGSTPGLGIGNTQGTTYDFNFDGNIDEISLYSRALSQSEIQSIVNQVPEPGSATLVGFGLSGALLMAWFRRGRIQAIGIDFDPQNT